MLPSIEVLLNRIADTCFIARPRDEKRRQVQQQQRDQFLSKLKELYDGADGGKFPDFGLTFLEAERTCQVLEEALRSNNKNQRAITASLPTRNEWQYACRAISDKRQTGPSLILAVRLTSTGARSLSASRDKDVIRLYLDMSELFARLKEDGFRFHGTIGNVAPIDLSTPDQVVKFMERLAEFEEESLKPHPKIDTKTIQEIQNSKRLFLCFLREVMIRTVADSSRQDSVPITLGLPTLERVLIATTSKGNMQTSLGLEEMLGKLRHLDDATSSFPNRWEIIHMVGNVREWARESGAGGDRAVVVDTGVFDFSPRWRHCLIWHADTLADKTVIDGDGVVLAGLRPVIKLNVRP